MKLTYKDIKNSVRRLCFLEESEYEDYEEYMTEAVNFAMLEIARQFPLTDRYTVEQEFDDNETGYATYDMSELTKDDETGQEVFMGFSEKYPLICLSDDNGIEFSDYVILEDRYLLLNKRHKGSFLAFYKKYPKRIKETTKDEHEIEFKPETANLIPLLCAWRIFKDDDETKAALYYNEYLRMKDELSVSDEVKRRPLNIGFIEREGVYS